MHLTCMYQGPQRVTKSGEAKTLLLCECLSTHTIDASTPPTLACPLLQHSTHASTPPRQARHRLQHVTRTSNSTTPSTLLQHSCKHATHATQARTNCHAISQTRQQIYLNFSEIDIQKQSNSFIRSVIIENYAVEFDSTKLTGESHIQFLTQCVIITQIT